MTDDLVRCYQLRRQLQKAEAVQREQFFFYFIGDEVAFLLDIIQEKINKLEVERARNGKADET